MQRRLELLRFDMRQDAEQFSLCYPAHWDQLSSAIKYPQVRFYHPHLRHNYSPVIQNENNIFALEVHYRGG